MESLDHPSLFEWSTSVHLTSETQGRCTKHPSTLILLKSFHKQNMSKSEMKHYARINKMG